jgi:hypothetical protein
MKESHKGVLATIAGFMINLVLGSIMVWGNIIVYVSSYFRQFDTDVSLSMAFYTLPCTVLMANICTYPGSLMTLRWSPRVTCTIGLILSAGAIFASSFA